MAQSNKTCGICGETGHSRFYCRSVVRKICLNCGGSHYEAFCPYKVHKPIPKKGKQTLIYEAWRDTIAIPYLDKKYGRICASCKGKRCGNKQLDVEHKLNRGSHPQLKMDVKNVQYMGRYPCHYEKTNGITEKPLT